MRTQLILGLSTWLLVAAMPVAFSAPTAEAILTAMDDAESFTTVYMEMKQDITTTSGSVRTLVARSWAKRSNEVALVEYLQPTDVKGQKLLMRGFGDDIWMFNPETRRTRKLGSHMRKRKVMGSDFTYEDQASGRMTERYAGKVLGAEAVAAEPCWVLELFPTPDGPSYGKVVVWAHKLSSLLMRADYYESRKSPKPFKRLVMSDVRKVPDRHPKKGRIERPFPFALTMTNLEDDTKTVSTMTKVVLGAEIPDRIFEARNLEKAR